MGPLVCSQQEAPASASAGQMQSLLVATASFMVSLGMPGQQCMHLNSPEQCRCSALDLELLSCVASWSAPQMQASWALHAFYGIRAWQHCMALHQPGCHLHASSFGASGAGDAFVQPSSDTLHSRCTSRWPLLPPRHSASCWARAGQPCASGLTCYNGRQDATGGYCGLTSVVATGAACSASSEPPAAANVWVCM